MRGRRTASLLVRLAALAALATLSVDAAAEPRVLDWLGIEEIDDRVSVTVLLTVPVRHLGHTLGEAGDRVHIRLRREDAVRIGGQTVSQDRLVADRGSAAGLIDATYTELTASTAELVLRFAGPVEVDEVVIPDQRRLQVIVAPAVPAGQDPAPLPGGDPGTLIVPEFTVNLQSTESRPDEAALRARPELSGYLLYVQETPVQDRTWYRTRVGFFYSRPEAQRAVDRLEAVFPKAWVSSVSALERQMATDWARRNGIRAERVDTREAGADPTPAAGPEDKIALLMEKARQAMVAGDYELAVQYYTRILQSGDERHLADAQEFLAVARQKNGQYAHAKAEYERYLQRFPDGEGAERVEQRLRGLLTSELPPKRRLATKQDPVRPEVRWDVFGGLSQFYRWQRTDIAQAEPLETDNSLNSDLNLTARRRSDRHDLTTQLIANNRYVFLAGQDDPSDSRLQSLYVGLTERNDHYGGRLGRQNHNRDGVLGRFDGLLASYRPATLVNLKVVAGYPVNLADRDRVDTDRSFVGLSTDIGTLAKRWDTNLYVIEQTADGVTDRQAVGTEIRYFDQRRSLFLLVDYDLHFDDLNQATLIGNWLFPGNANLGLQADYRYTPLLTTTNARIGQPVTSLEELLRTASEEEVKQLARDRTPRFKAVTLSGTLPLGPSVQLAGDVTASELEGTPATGGVPALAGTGTQYFYNAQVILNGLLSTGDVTIFGLRHNDLGSGRSSRVSFSSRFAAGKWRLNPRLLVERQDRETVDRTLAVPELRVDYRIGRGLRFESQFGYENADTRDAFGDIEQDTYYVYAGYVYNF